MNLEEAISHLKELIDNHDFGCLGCKRDHEELLGFLEELKQRRGEDGRRCRSMKDAMLEALDDNGILLVPYRDAKKLIEAAKTVDAVPVVRCRDCKFAYINSFSAASGIALCTSSGQPMQQDDFCSYGERKDGAEC